MSLKDLGALDKPTAPQLLVNGEKDTQVPIEDLYIVLRTGTNPRQAWVNPTGGHIGRNRGLSDAPIFEGVTRLGLRAGSGKYRPHCRCAPAASAPH